MVPPAEAGVAHNPIPTAAVMRLTSIRRMDTSSRAGMVPVPRRSSRRSTCTRSDRTTGVRARHCATEGGAPASALGGNGRPLPATTIPAMKVVALAGGVGAGKFLRGLRRAEPRGLDAVVVNTGDDIEILGLHVSPDLDSVCYWLSGAADRERGWGMA